MIYKTQIKNMILHFESTFSNVERVIKLWNEVKIDPKLWKINQHSKIQDAWVIAKYNNKCLYYNEIECGWAWVDFTHLGILDSYHNEQYDLSQAIYQLESIS